MASAGGIGILASGGVDPRMSTDAGRPRPIIPQERLLHDPAVTFDEYRYYAERTRAEEEEAAKLPGPKKGILQIIFPPKNGPSVVRVNSGNSPPGGEDEKRGTSTSGNTNLARRDLRLTITDEEWTNASRAMRTATWAACFYLITTDVLGPFGIGFAIGTLGWGPGIGLFTAFGLAAGYGGYLLWMTFLGLDSYEFPLRNYGDLAFRIYGTIPRYFVNVLQSVQLLCSVGLIVISNGQALSQVSKFRLCYAVCCLIWAICGFAIGQVRTLQRFGWLANLAIWINLITMFISMGVISHSPPNYGVAAFGSAGATTVPADVTPVNGVFPAVKHYAGLPDPSSLVGSINGLMQGVYAYGGAQLFIEFMAEMRRPRDFIKAMWSAQAFIYLMYMFYGLFCYGYQGQYVYSLAYLGVSPYGWQTVGNMLAVLSGIIAAALYGNIGIKVLYNNVLMDIFAAPPLTTKPGKILWAVIVPVYWSIAYIVAAAIPDFFGLVSVVAAFCAVQFTYSFPPILALGFLIHKGAMQDGEGFDPATGATVHHDSGPRRWLRGFLRGPWYFSVLNVVHAGAALATAGLGAYAAITGMIAAFKQPQVNAFSCHSPLDSS
ncbi:amino acid transporter [Glonium stellatum]|uniref:Amino acid transporter n=1 Tax=Glonium stellatum TaxID=574774 RepID=A0A8E2ER00_9PEZI|nr:amino acid transporter [Glonium stellatum]